MAIRTTSAAVSAIIEVDSSISLTPFIEAASSHVDDVAAADGAPNAAKLELIERYLSAHFYTLRDPRPVNEQVGSLQNTFQSRVDLGFATSHYGQMAMSFDSTGVLKAASRGKRATGITWLGLDADRGLAEGT